MRDLQSHGGGTLSWAERLVAGFKAADVSLAAYVPDTNIYNAVRLMEDDPFFRVVTCTREEEAVGIAMGSYAVGRRAVVLMQSSGFGNTINAIASLCIPHRLPIPMVINLRGELGDFNICQVPLGRATRPILDVLGLPHYTLTEERDVDRIVPGALKLCYASRQPLAICITPLLHGGKVA